jgi:hypothetical protein
VIPWKSPLLGTFVLALVLLVAVSGWLLTDPATSHSDALKTGGLAGGAVVALYALWLNDRRRRVEERRQEIERQRHLLEQLRTEQDRSRVSDERFAKAIELLGHSADQVRVGALHALAGVGRNREEYTQTVLDVICAYLRRPFAHPDYGDDVESPTVADNERQVRRTAQKLIRDLLPDVTAEGAPTYGVDLTGAKLVGFTLSRRRVGWLGLQYCEILRGVDFEDTSFEDMAYFTGTKVKGPANFSRTRFGGKAGFRDFTTSEVTTFAGAEFAQEPDFTGATVPSGSTLPAAK